MKGWHQVALGEAATLQAGFGFPPALQGRRTGDYPFAKVGDISRSGREGRSTLETADHYVDARDLKTLDAKPVPKGSTLFAKIGEAIRQNHRVIAGCELLIDNNAMAAIPNDGTDSRFLYHWLRTVDFYRVASATTVPALRKSDLARIAMPFPPYHEQQRIADVLDRADALRAKRRAGLALLDTLTQSIFLEMFGDPIANPRQWKTAELRAVAAVRTGRTPPGSREGMYGDAVPFMTPGDLESDEPPARWLTDEGANASVTVPPGTTLVCCIGAVGKVGRTTRLSAFNQQINSLAWGPSIDAEYGFRMVGFLRATIAEASTSSILPILKKSLFERIRVPVPPLQAQEVFASRIFRMESLKSSHRASLAELDALFASLQHRAFRGEL